MLIFIFETKNFCVLLVTVFVVMYFFFFFLVPLEMYYLIKCASYTHWHFQIEECSNRRVCVGYIHKSIK